MLQLRISNSRAKSPFQLIHMDLVGPVEESIHLNRYFLTILDDFSRFGWVLFLQISHYGFDLLKIFLRKQLHTYVLNNGTEFNNSKFKSFCSQKSITQQFTTPYNPQENGRAERFNGILISAAKSLLNDSKLSKEFWVYAIDTANIHNRIPHSGIHNKIPFEVLFKTKTDFSHFKVFGCKVFFFVPNSLRNKFDNNALPGIFLGYHALTNAYKILNIANNQIIYSRSVEFFEDSPGNSKISPPINQYFQNFLPNSEIRGSDTYTFNKFNNPNNIPFYSQNINFQHNKNSINDNYSIDNTKYNNTKNNNSYSENSTNIDINSKDKELNQIIQYRNKAQQHL